MEGEEGERHYTESYQVLAVGCNEQVRAESRIIVPVVRKVDGARIRLEVLDCHHESKQLPDLAKACDVLVIYYTHLEEMRRYMLAIFPHLSTLARVVRVCLNPSSNVERASYYFPMKEPSNFFVEMDNGESEVISQVFWQEVSLGRDYRNMETTDMEGKHQIKFTPGEAEITPPENPSRCSTVCTIM